MWDNLKKGTFSPLVTGPKIHSNREPGIIVPVTDYRAQIGSSVSICLTFCQASRSRFDLHTSGSGHLCNNSLSAPPYRVVPVPCRVEPGDRRPARSGCFPYCKELKTTGQTPAGSARRYPGFRSHHVRGGAVAYLSSLLCVVNNPI